jgi:tryptophanyl-tRNA synthetase
VADGLVKKRLLDILEAVIAPIREKRLELQKNPEYLLSVLREGTEHAKAVAEENLKFIREHFTLSLK